MGYLELKLFGGDMSVDFYLVCKKHKHKVLACSDGMSGPMNQCDWSLACFLITHRDCELNVIDEHMDEDDFEDFIEWDSDNREELLNYDLNNTDKAW